MARSINTTRARPAQVAPGGPRRASRAARRSPRRWDREQIFTAGLFLAPAAIVLGVFVFYPILDAGWVSLTSWNGFNPTKEFVGADNYVRMLQDPNFWNSLLVTLVYAAGVCVLAVVTGLGIALLLDAPLRGRAIYRTIYFLPAVTSSVAGAIVWKYMLDPAGLVNGLLSHIGITGPDWLQHRWLALGALTLLTVWKDIGFNAVLYLTALQTLPTNVYEAAHLDGASPAQRIRYITVPLLAPMTFFVVIQALITSFEAFDLVYVLTGGGPRGGTDVLGMFMYRTAFRLGDFGYGTAIAFVSLLLVLSVTLVQWRAGGSGGKTK